MAKAKSGGTRSYIRGRVGADVYSIGRDAKGKKQQVVRSLAETVANPQTQSQMRGRMIMSTLMQVVAALKPIIDHSFDNVTGKQPNISEFIARNYALIKADVAAHPASGNAFGLVKYQEKGAKRGQYVISDGQAQLPSALVLTPASGVIAITMASDAVTIAGLKAALGMTSDEYFTLVGIKADGGAAYERFRVNPNLADSTAISGSNIADVFAVEGNATASISIASNVISITLASVATCCAVIISKKTASGYIHNEAKLGAGDSFDYNSNAALPTYPVGSADYLNGGDIFGQSESFNGGDEPTPPSPPKYALTYTKSGNGTGVVRVNNQTIASGTELDEGTECQILATAETGKTVSATVNGVDVPLTYDSQNDNYKATFNMPAQATTVAINTAVEPAPAQTTEWNIDGQDDSNISDRITLAAGQAHVIKQDSTKASGIPHNNWAFSGSPNSNVPVNGVTQSTDGNVTTTNIAASVPAGTYYMGDLDGSSFSSVVTVVLS